MSKVNLIPAAQFFTIREYCTNLKDIEESMLKVKDIGYNAVQLSAVDFSDPKGLAKLVEKHELDVCVTHMPLDRLLNDTQNLINEHKAYGCDTIGIGGLPGEYQSSAEGYYEFAKIANEIARKLKAENMNFSYHNHAFELMRFGDTNGFDILIDNTDDNVMFTLDLYWVQAGGGFPTDYLKKLEGRIKVAHFKDMGANGNSPILAPVGEGNMNYQEITRVANETGVKYAAVEQDECYDANPFECLKASYKNLANYITNIK